MSKPVWVSLVRSGRSVCEAFLHEPSEDSSFGGVWVKYVPASELEVIETEWAQICGDANKLAVSRGYRINELEAKIDQMSEYLTPNEIAYLTEQRVSHE